MRLPLTRATIALPVFVFLLPATFGARPVAPQEEQEPLRLPQVLVSGRSLDEGVPRVPLTAVGSRDVLGPEDVRATGARDVNDLLLHLPALSTRPYNGGEAAAPSFSTRGLPDDGLTEYVNVLIDGVPAGPMPYGWTAFSFFPLTTERIWAVDWLRGAHSVRYSPNTVGGVLNFVTRPIPTEPEATALKVVGDHGFQSDMLSGGGAVGAWSWRVSAVDREGDGYRANGGFAQEDYSVKLRQELGADSWWSGTVSYMASEHQAPGGLTQTQFAADRFGNARPMNRFDGYRSVVDLVVHDDLANGWLETFAWYSSTRRNLYAQRPHFPAPGDPIEFNDWNDTTHVAALGARVEHAFGGHTLYGGIRALREWMPAWTVDVGPDGGPLAETANLEASMETLSLHLDDTFSPVEGVEVTVGGRLEWVPRVEAIEKTAAAFRAEDDFLAFLPGVGVSWLAADGWSVFANWFEGFRAPQAWGWAFTTDPDNTDLDFERSTAFELGTRWRPTENVESSLTLWRNRYSDFGVFWSGFYENLGDIDAEGVDLAAFWDLGETVEGLSLQGSLTLQDATLEGGPDAGNDVPYAWDTKAAWRASYELGGAWRASLGGTYVGESFSDEANTVAENADGNLGRNASRVLWDAQVGREFDVGRAGLLRVGVGATNLTDEEWFVHSRGGFFGGGKVSGAPRQVFASVDLTVSL